MMVFVILTEAYIDYNEFVSPLRMNSFLIHSPKVIKTSETLTCEMSMVYNEVSLNDKLLSFSESDEENYSFLTHDGLAIYYEDRPPNSQMPYFSTKITPSLKKIIGNRTVYGVL